MAQAKRKRRTKHRGTAAGVIEARGRTGRPSTPAERKRNDRDRKRELRLNTPPTWNGSIKRAALASGFMMLFLIIISKGSISHKLASAVVVAALAFLVYAPSGYYLEKFLFRRRMAKQGTPVK